MIHDIHYKNINLSVPGGGGLVLGFHHHLQPVEEDVLDAAPEVLLVAEEDLVKVAHAAHEDAVVYVQLVEPARQLGPTKPVLVSCWDGVT